MDPLDGLRAELDRFRSAAVPGLPRFAGGLVGYLSYEMIRYFEPSVAVEPHAELPDGLFLLTDTLVAFDHAFGRLLLIANIYPGEDDEAAARSAAEARLDEIERRLLAPLPRCPHASRPSRFRPKLRSNMTREQYCRGGAGGQGTHRGGRYLPGGAFAAPEPRDDRRTVRHLPRAAPLEPIPVHVFL